MFYIPEDPYDLGANFTKGASVDLAPRESVSRSRR